MYSGICEEENQDQLRISGEGVLGAELFHTRNKPEAAFKPVQWRQIGLSSLSVKHRSSLSKMKSMETLSLPCQGVAKHIAANDAGIY